MSGQISVSPDELLELTVALPVFNEVENLPLLWPELIGVLDSGLTATPDADDRGDFQIPPEPLLHRCKRSRWGSENS